MSHKDKKDDLDTETTIVDMNVEGFKWYDPSKKKRKDNSMKTSAPKVTRREYWRMVRAAFVAALPVFAIIIFIGAFLFGLAYLWLS